MKEIKPKSADVNTSSTNTLQKHSQATEEQIRYAKLSQQNSREDKNIQEKIREVTEITGKHADIASIALHDCNYDTQSAVQNIFEGTYDQEEDEWATTTKKGKSKKATSGTPPVPDDTSDEPRRSPVVKPITSRHSDTIDLIEEPEQKASKPPTRLSRGGGSAFTHRGRSNTSRNWRNEDRNQDDEKSVQSHDRDSSYDRSRSFNDRGRGRGRGRGFRGGLNRGTGRGAGRGGFGRGGFRGNSRQDSGRNKRGGFSGFQENNNNNTNKTQENGGFNPTTEESWDDDTTDTTNKSTKVEDWSDDIVDDSPSADWSKPDWVEGKETAGVFTNDWSQSNGLSDWCNDDSSKNLKEKYIPENIDTAVIRSIPTSSSAGEVTSYQATNDINRYITSTSNQFPSSHQEGELTSSLNDRTFCLSSGSNFTDSVKRTVASMPMVSGVTESHKLEEEQLSVSKSDRSGGQRPSRKMQNRFPQLPSQPVVMPRSAQMVNDIEDQFSGLEFGSGPISPRFKRMEEQHNASTAGLSSSSASTETTTNSMSDVNRHPSMPAVEKEPLLSAKPIQPLSSQQPGGLLASKQQVIPSSPAKLEPPNHVVAKPEIPKTPPGFKPLDQQSVASHYLGSPGRGLGQMQPPEPIPFPTKNRTPPTSSLNSVFNRSPGLSSSLGSSDGQKLGFKDQQQTYDQETSLSAEKVLAQQRALAEKQYLAEQQRALTEQRERERVKADQRAFAEQKSLAQQKLLASQRSHEDERKTDVTDRKNIVDNRLGLGEVSKESSPSKYNSSNKYLSSKMQSTSSNTSSSNHNIQHAPVQNEMLGLTSATGIQTTAKAYTSASKVSNPPPGVMHQPHMNMYNHGVQPGLIPPGYQQQHIPGYNYDDLLQMQRGMPVSPYGYDVSLYQAAAGGPAMTTRDGLQTYAGTAPKFTGGSEDTSVGMPVNPQMPGSNLTAHQQAYLNTGQFPYGITYAYQPGVLPQGGVYPASAIYQVQQQQQQSKANSQYQSQYQQQQQQPPPQQAGYNNTKYSAGTSSHDYNKGSYYTQAALSQAQHGKMSQPNATTCGNQSSVHQTGPQSTYKSHYNADGKGSFHANTSSINPQQQQQQQQPGLHMHNQPHLGSINPFLLQQQVGGAHGNQVQMQFNTPGVGGGNQGKRDHNKGNNYQSHWFGGNR